MQTRRLLRELLYRSGLKANDLAIRLAGDGVTQSAISRFMTGKTVEPRRSSLAPIARYFGIDVDAFFDDELASELLAQLASGQFLVGRTGAILAPNTSPLQAKAPAAAYNVNRNDAWPFETVARGEWASLPKNQRTLIECQIRLAIDGFAKAASSKQEPVSMATPLKKPCAPIGSA